MKPDQSETTSGACCHGVDDVCVASGCLMGIPGGEDEWEDDEE